MKIATIGTTLRMVSPARVTRRTYRTAGNRSSDAACGFANRGVLDSRSRKRRHQSATQQRYNFPRDLPLKTISGLRAQLRRRSYPEFERQFRSRYASHAFLWPDE